MPVGFPNGVPKGPSVLYQRKVILATLCFIAAACAGTDGGGTTPDVASLTGTAPALSVKPREVKTTLKTSATPTAGTQSLADGPDISGNAFLADDYRSYANTAALLNNISSLHNGTGSPRTAMYNDGPYAGLAVLDTVVTYNGHPTVRYDQPGGVAGTPELWPSFPNGKTVTNMWLRAVIKFSPGFTTYGPVPTPSYAYKLLGWGWAGANGRGGVGFTNTTDYTLTWGVERDGASDGFVEQTGFSHVTTEWTDGAWYDYVIHYEQTSATTTRTSFYLGKGTSTPVLVYVMNGTINPGAVIPPVSRIMLGLNFNSPRAVGQNQALWYGQWEVVDGSQYSNPFNLN
jgi:hypothetical protein